MTGDIHVTLHHLSLFVPPANEVEPDALEFLFGGLDSYMIRLVATSGLIITAPPERSIDIYDFGVQDELRLYLPLLGDAIHRHVGGQAVELRRPRALEPPAQADRV
jgi:hypothetical protein